MLRQRKKTINPRVNLLALGSFCFVLEYSKLIEDLKMYWMTQADFPIKKL